MDISVQILKACCEQILVKGETKIPGQNLLFFFSHTIQFPVISPDTKEWNTQDFQQ